MLTDEFVVPKKIYLFLYSTHCHNKLVVGLKNDWHLSVGQSPYYLIGAPNIGNEMERPSFPGLVNGTLPKNSHCEVMLANINQDHSKVLHGTSDRLFVVDVIKRRMV